MAVRMSMYMMFWSAVWIILFIHFTAATLAVALATQNPV